jgi:dihydrofolate reductase
MMGNLVVSEFISLDGVIEAPDTWNLPYMNQEAALIIRDDLVASDALLYGRRTFEVMAAAWPSRTDELGVAKRFNELPKFVVSNTLSDVSWNKSKILRGQNLDEEIKGLKSAHNRDILVWGSHHLVQSLVQRNLVDEYRLYVHPLVLGKGKVLFPAGSEIRRLELQGTQTVSTGVVVSSYRVLPSVAPS